MMILFAVFFLGLPIWGIVDAAMRPQVAWAGAGQNQLVWVLVQIFLSVVGTLVYLLAIRPRLIAVQGTLPQR